MDFFNNISKIFIDLFAYIPAIVIRLLLFIFYLYFLDISNLENILIILDKHIILVFIISFALLYPLNILFTYFSKYFKVRKNKLTEKQVKNIIKENKELKKIYLIQDKNIDNFQSGLLDISSNIGYNIPFFFENKIILYKSVRDTFIVFSYINIILFLYLYISNELTKNNIMFLIILTIIYIIFSKIIKEEIIKYNEGYKNSLLNINRFITLYNNK